MVPIHSTIAGKDLRFSKLRCPVPKSASLMDILSNRECQGYKRLAKGNTLKGGAPKRFLLPLGMLLELFEIQSPLRSGEFKTCLERGF